MYIYICRHRSWFLPTKKKERVPTNHNRAADAHLVTSLLAVTNEPVHTVLALEMSRGGKMSLQIASGHQMSPLHSLVLLCAGPLLLLLLPFSSLSPPAVY